MYVCVLYLHVQNCVLHCFALIIIASISYNLIPCVCFFSSSVPANASDSLYCMLLAQNAVHGAMAGYTAFSTGEYLY
ncbi:hypothetical protein EON63_14370 [archaeon]|nr:MAG: hypothetical protein EON63_14370 [archaeon]